jgi:hypothetical protein
MITITKITLTGVDESTDIDRLVQMAAAHPFVEFGFLYTTSPEGRSRYPRREWLEAVLPKFPDSAALHICGSGARKELVEGRLVDLTRHTQRVQVNGIVGLDELENLSSKVNIILTQHTVRNQKLLTATHLMNHCVLIDDSGGRGISPETWNPPETSKHVGFAGGLGPDNLGTELTKIQAVAGSTGSWIDMEGKLRTHDIFDLDKVQACIDIYRACW